MPKTGQNRKMKKIITFVLIFSIGCLFFCGCKKDKDSNGANTSEGVDAVAVGDMEEETVVVDFETGSIISVPSDKNDNKTDSKNESKNEDSSAGKITEIIEEAGKPSSGSSDSNSSSGSSSTSGSSSDSSSSSEDVMGGFSPWE